MPIKLNYAVENIIFYSFVNNKDISSQHLIDAMTSGGVTITI